MAERRPPVPSADPGGDDALLAFFAAERRAIEDQPADDVTWARVRQRATRRRRTAWLAPLAAAAAVVVALTVSLSWLGRQPTQLTSAPTPTSPMPATSAVRGDLTGFTVTSLSTARTGVLYAMGSLPCTASQAPTSQAPTAQASTAQGVAGRCPALAKSVDEGGSWALVHTFRDEGVAVTAVPGWPAVVPGAHALRGVRFANDQVGFAYGGDLLRTADGGHTWQRYDTGGLRALALETDGTSVFMVLGSGCGSTSCTSGLTLGSAPVAATSVRTTTVVDGTRDSAVSTVNLSLLRGSTGTEPALAFTLEGANVPIASVRFTAAGQVPIAGSGCPGPTAGPGDGVAVVSQSARRDALFAWCVTGWATQNAFVRLAKAAPSGRFVEVRPAGDPPVLMLPGAPVEVVADDGRHLVAASARRTPEYLGSLSVSQDGGRSWQAAAGATAGQGIGWGWVGAAGGGRFLALPDQPSGSYWQSRDAGLTWHEVRIAG